MINQRTNPAAAMTPKRKAPWSQPATNNYKKPRTENGNHTNHHHETSPRNNSNSLPAIPPITPELSTAVFTHQGMAGVHSNSQPPSQEMTYDRLEFLGDAYIEVIATRLIWESYKSLSAGRMSQIRELLVKNETLHEYALAYSFDKRIKAQDFQREDPKRWLKIVADVFEAYVAAVVLSDPVGGFKAAEEWLVALWQPKLKDVKATAPNLKAKEELARKIMAKGVKLNYRDEAPMQQLKGGMQTYFIGVYLTGWGWEDLHLGSGTGLSKVAAGNEAAARALENRVVMEQITEKRTRYLDEQKADKEKAEMAKQSAEKIYD
jgi:ribonuclease-3